MTPDRYTKSILTIIAFCLSVLAADKVYSTIVPVAHAGSQELIKCNVPNKGWVYCAPVVVGSMNY